MTTKTAGKVPEPPLSRDDVQTAYQVHTLAQMLYGQLALANPWIVQPYPQTLAGPFAGQAIAGWGTQLPPVWGAGPNYPVPGPTYGPPVGFAPYPMSVPFFPR